jgi:apolipoprotein N-acyltransferase
MTNLPATGWMGQRRAYLWLGLACALGIFASGSHSVAPAAWLAPIFALRFARLQTPLRGYGLLVVTGIPVLLASWSFFPFGGWPGLAAFAVGASVFGNLPYLLDRWLAPRRPALARTLVLPLAATGLEWFGGQGSFGSWGAVGYTQLEVAPVRQVLSAAGLAGVAFLIAWTAALVNGWWEQGFRRGPGLRPLCAAAAAIGLVLAWGGLRPVLTARPEQAVRVAALSVGRGELFASREIGARWRSGQPLEAADREAMREHWAGSNEALMARVEQAAREGARLVATSEGSFVLLDEDEAALQARAQQVARQHRATLALGVLVLPTTGRARWQNKVVLLDERGERAWEYHKAIPTPGGETAYSEAGDGKLLVHDTSWGRVAAVICYDADFPQLVLQAGRQAADLLIVPAADWPAVAEIHAGMSRARAVEQGVTLLRPAAAGVATLVDPLGVELERRPYDGSAVSALVADAPVGRVPTLYTSIGDALGALSALAVAGWAMAAALRGLLRRLLRR